MAVVMFPVDSDMASEIGHDPETGLVHVTFHKGGTHLFGPFSAQQFEAFKTAPSIGKHFHAHIRAKATK